MIEMDLKIGEYYKVIDKITRKIYEGMLIYYTLEGICINDHNKSHFFNFESYEIKIAKK